MPPLPVGHALQRGKLLPEVHSESTGGLVPPGRHDTSSTCSDHSSNSSESAGFTVDFFERQRQEIAKWIANSIHDRGADPEKVQRACQALVQHTFSQVEEARKRGPSPITNRTMMRPGDYSRSAN